MIVTRLKLPLEQAEYGALLKVANNELRDPVDQVRFILRQELERRGLLQAEPALTNTLCADSSKQEGNNVTE